MQTYTVAILVMIFIKFLPIFTEYNTSLLIIYTTEATVYSIEQNKINSFEMK